jgi:hypothetical protein
LIIDIWLFKTFLLGLLLNLPFLIGLRDHHRWLELIALLNLGFRSLLLS